jgi:hypothetical protein
MWILRTFRTKNAMIKFINLHAKKIQWNEIFINNGHAIEYRYLRIIDIK